jgi:hypothetical protein
MRNGKDTHRGATRMRDRSRREARHFVPSVGDGELEHSGFAIGLPAEPRHCGWVRTVSL